VVPTGQIKPDPSKLYENVRKRARLWRAWTEVHRKAVTSKSRETRGEAREFARGIVRHIDRIARQLRQDRFKFLPQRGVLIPKSGGRFRPIVVAPIASRIVQRSILDTLQSLPEIRRELCAGYNFGGVPGEDFGVPGAIVKAQSEITERPFYIRTDVKSFFEHVNKPLAIARVLAFTDDKKFADFFEAAVQTELADASRYGDRVKLFPLADEGVAQGSCLSPLLCNLLLSEVDKQLNDRSVVAIRYIDDILILGKSAKAVLKAFDAAQEKLAGMGLSCYDPRLVEDKGKAEFGNARDGLTFLGCELIGREVRPSKANRQQLLQSVEATCEESLRLLSDPAKAIENRASYAETIVFVSKVVQGWANTFAFCTDDRVIGSLDAEINRLVEDFTKRAWRRLRGASALNRRRGLGVFAIADRVQPVSVSLVKSLRVTSAH